MMKTSKNLYVDCVSYSSQRIAIFAIKDGSLLGTKSAQNL